MDNQAIDRVRSFLRTYSGSSELILALVPVVSGPLTQKVILLLRHLCLPSRLKPLQARFTSSAFPNEEEWQRFQREVRETYKDSFWEDLWRAAEQVPQRQLDKMLGNFLDRFERARTRGADEGRATGPKSGRKRKRNDDLGDDKVTVSAISPPPADGKPPGYEEFG